MAPCDVKSSPHDTVFTQRKTRCLYIMYIKLLYHVHVLVTREHFFSFFLMVKYHQPVTAVLYQEHEVNLVEQFNSLSLDKISIILKIIYNSINI